MFCVEKQWYDNGNCKPSSTESRGGSGQLKSVMCSDGTEGTGGFQRARVRTEWFPPLINAISLTHIPHFALYSLTCLTERPHLLSGQFIQAPTPTVIYSDNAEKRH